MASAFTVLTFFSDYECGTKPEYIDTIGGCSSDSSSDNSSSSSGGSGVCLIGGQNSTFFYTLSCVEDRFAAIREAFQDDEFAGYDIYSDGLCDNYSETLVYSLGSCVATYPNNSAIAKLDGSSASLDVYSGNSGCGTVGKTSYNVNASVLSEGLCVGEYKPNT